MNRGSGVGRRVARLVGFVFLGVVGLVMVWFGVASVVYSPTYVVRVLTMRQSSQADYLENFPTRVLDAATSPYEYEVELDPGVEEGLEAAFAVADIDDFMASTNTQALLVVENDLVVFERYSNGAQRDTMLTSFSVAKSFDSVLVGIAIDEGFIGSVDDPITDYLPELTDEDPRLSDITIGHTIPSCSG